MRWGMGGARGDTGGGIPGTRGRAGGGTPGTRGGTGGSHGGGGTGRVLWLCVELDALKVPDHDVKDRLLGDLYKKKTKYHERVVNFDEL